MHFIGPDGQTRIGPWLLHDSHDEVLKILESCEISTAVICCSVPLTNCFDVADAPARFNGFHLVGGNGLNRKETTESNRLRLLTGRHCYVLDRLKSSREAKVHVETVHAEGCHKSGRLRPSMLSLLHNINKRRPCHSVSKVVCCFDERGKRQDSEWQDC